LMSCSRKQQRWIMAFHYETGVSARAIM